MKKVPLRTEPLNKRGIFEIKLCYIKYESFSVPGGGFYKWEWDADSAKISKAIASLERFSSRGCEPFAHYGALFGALAQPTSKLFRLDIRVFPKYTFSKIKISAI